MTASDKMRRRPIEDELPDFEDYSILTDAEREGSPTEHAGGSEHKIVLLAWRYKRGMDLHVRGDYQHSVSQSRNINLDAFVRGFTAGVEHTVAVQGEDCSDE
jgi:hypothetical protein